MTDPTRIAALQRLDQADADLREAVRVLVRVAKAEGVSSPEEEIERLRAAYPGQFFGFTDVAQLAYVWDEM